MDNSFIKKAKSLSKENRKEHWESIGLISDLSENGKENIIWIFDALVECMTDFDKDEAFYYVPCLRRIFTLLYDAKPKFNSYYDIIIIDINDFITYFDLNFTKVVDSLNTLRNTDETLEANILISKSYARNLVSIFRSEELTNEYLIKITHSLPISISRDNNIRKILS